MTLLFSEHGSRVGCYDYEADAVKRVLKQAKEDSQVDEKLVHGFTSLDKLAEAFPKGTAHPRLLLFFSVEKLTPSADGKKPRIVVISLPHGKAVDGILEDVLPRLKEGDIVIDGGNEWWADTERRQRRAAEKGVRWVGMGVSGGCEWSPDAQARRTGHSA